MPKVTVYIREGDYELWKSIKKKTEFMHLALVPHFGTPPADMVPVIPDSIKGVGYYTPMDIATVNKKGKPVSIVGKLPDDTFGIRVDEKGLKFCPHGADPKMCKFAKPGKECK